MKPVAIYFRAYLIYLMITLPSMLFPPMYMLSALYALVFGFASCLVFTMAYFAIKTARFNFQSKFILLVITIPIAVAVGHTLIGVFNVEDNVWDLNLFLCFPSVAIVSGWISLHVNKRSVREEFTGEEAQEFPIVI